MTLSTLAWLDFAERDRRRMLDVVNLFRQQDTRDELGIGSLRDAFSELLFPGSSTIQTRARYFLFVPWLYQYREERLRWSATRSSIPQLMRDYEIELISHLEKGGESEGVIGIDARRHLQRLPSSIYWSGLARWGIRRFDMSIAEYHRWLAGMPKGAERVWTDDDGEPVAGHATQRWDPAIPPPPDDWLDQLTFRLRAEEAEYLRERVLATCPETLLAYLIDRTEPVDRTVSFVWMHPQLAAFPGRLRAQIEHARLASLVMNGAAWLYNVMLAEAQGSGDAAETYRVALDEWALALLDDEAAIRRWDYHDMWRLLAEGAIAIGRRTQHFVSSWSDLMTGRRLWDGLADDPGARTIIAERERELKRGRSRLDNRRLLDLWTGPSGVGRLHYRWNPVVRDTVNDMLLGLARGTVDGA